MVAPAGSGKVVVGGRFALAQRRRAPTAWARSTPATGAPCRGRHTASSPTPGANSAIYYLSTDGAQVYGTGYDVRPGRQPRGHLRGERRRPARIDLGQRLPRRHLRRCAPIGGVLYTRRPPARLRHDRRVPADRTPWTSSGRLRHDHDAPAADGRVNSYGELDGPARPGAPALVPDARRRHLHRPVRRPRGRVTGNNEYVVLGGEFPRVNGVAQQGLVRFAVSRSRRTSKGPQGGAELTPTLVSLAPGTGPDLVARRPGTATTGADLRGAARRHCGTAHGRRHRRPPTRPGGTARRSASPTPARRRARPRPTGSAVGPVRQPGRGRHRARSPCTAGTARRERLPRRGARRRRVELLAAGRAERHRRGYDWAGADDLTARRRGDPGRRRRAASATSSTATTFAGTAACPAATTTRSTAPTTFTVEAWFKTTTTSGGRSSASATAHAGTSGNYDRHVYMTNDGHGRLRRLPGGARHDHERRRLQRRPVAPRGRHPRPDGMALYVDGKRSASAPTRPSARPTTATGASAATTSTAGRTQPASTTSPAHRRGRRSTRRRCRASGSNAQYAAAVATRTIPAAPADPYGAAVYDDDPLLYWRLGDTSGPPRRTPVPDANPGGYSAGVTSTSGIPARCAGTANAAVTFNGTTGSRQRTTRSPTRPCYSVEAWFKTTTTSGGRILGFGNGPAGSRVATTTGTSTCSTRASSCSGSGPARPTSSTPPALQRRAVAPRRRDAGPGRAEAVRRRGARRHRRRHRRAELHRLLAGRR